MFNLDYASIFQSIPREIATVLIATIPIAELRVAIPVALGSFNLSALSAYFWAVLGNILPIIFILWWLEPVSRWLSKRFRLFNRFFSWLFKRTRNRHSQRFERWGALALITFVAIPLPITGAWTGSVAAFVFGIPFKKALPLIFIGVLIAGLVVTLVSLGIFSFIS